jgi:hypothetical protein
MNNKKLTIARKLQQALINKAPQKATTAKHATTAVARGQVSKL